VGLGDDKLTRGSRAIRAASLVMNEAMASDEDRDDRGTRPLEPAMSREFLAKIIERVGHPIFVKDRRFRWVLLNKAFCEMIIRLKAAEDALRDVNEALERRVQERAVALETAQEELVRKERLAALGQLTGGLAHQIRNPLGSIANAAYVLKRALGEDAEPTATSSVAIILEETWRANRLISDLLDYARVRAPNLQPVSLRELLESVIVDHGVPHLIRVSVHAPSTPLVFVDEDQVRGAIDNLVRNAVEAMPSGGTLCFDARPEGAKMRLAVSDTGTGIAAEVGRRLFEPLITSKPLGRGLGLTTARALIENQGGTIDCESVKAGACFVVMLPLAP
jgi:signal transduction histidine kinase